MKFVCEVCRRWERKEGVKIVYEGSDGENLFEEKIDYFFTYRRNIVKNKISLWKNINKLKMVMCVFFCISNI